MREDGPSLEDCVAEYIARRESGEVWTPEDFARQHPDLEESLVRELLALEEAEALFPESSAELPETIGPYRVLGQLGRGGMGRVLAVEDTRRPGERLALKLLNPVALLNPRNRERFLREARVLARLDHPGIVRVREVGPEGETPYLVMDLVDGPSLAERLKEARGAGADAPELPGEGSSLRRACALVRDLARVVDVLHASGVVHRDLKPGNVLLAPDDTPVIVDFGLAAVDAAATLTRTGDLIGTPNYMAPEQALGRPADARVDVYALGAILYELLTLHPPHSGRDPVSVLESIRTEPVVPVRRVRPDVPGPLARVLERALAYTPGRRTASPAALADDLAAFLEDRPVQARASWAGRWFDFRRAHPRLLVAGAALAVLVAAGGLGWLAARPEEDVEVQLQQALDRATMAYAAGDTGAAARAAEEIVRLAPDDPTGQFLLLADVQAWDSDDPVIEALVEGTVERAEGNLREAEAEFRRAMQLAPESPLPVILMGQVAREIGERSGRIPELVAALALQPGSVALHLELGESYLLQQQCAEAAAAFEEALRLSPEPLAGAHAQRVRARHCAGGIAPALAALREALETLGGGSELNATMEWLVKEQDEGEALRGLLRELVDGRPGYVPFVVNLALAHDWDEELFEALGWYERALALDPENRTAMMCLMHLHSGANRATCADCQAAFAEHPEIYDPGKTEAYGLRALELWGTDSLGLAMFVVDACLRVERLDAVEARLEELHAVADSGKQTERLDKVLERVRAAR